MSVTNNAIVILTDIDGNQFRATLEQANALKALEGTRSGGFASVIGYRPSTGYVVAPTVDYQVLTRFSYGKLLDRKRDALDGITWKDIRDTVMALPKVAALGEEKARAEFDARKAKEMASISTTKLGIREDAHRQAHDRCYGRIMEGVRVHYETQKVDGISEPILTDGLPTADSIMLSVLVMNQSIREAGEHKVVNSGAPVLIGNAMGSLLNKRSVGFKALSLKPGNFESIKIGGVTLNEADTARFGDLLI